MSTSTSDADILNALQQLNVLINALPPSVPIATEDNPVYRNFSSFELIDAEEGPYFTVDRVWLRTFQVDPEEQNCLITRGEYGVHCALAFFEHFANHPDIRQFNGLFLLFERVKSLMAIIGRVLIKHGVVDLSQLEAKGNSEPTAQTAPKEQSTLGKRKKKAIVPVGSDESEGEPDALTRLIMPKNYFEKKKQKKAMGAKSRNAGKQRKKHAGDTDVSTPESSDREAGIDEIKASAGREANKASWAFAQYTPTPSRKDNNPIWRWSCNWCSKHRTSPRTKNCTDFEHEDSKLRAPKSSNFISHLAECKHLPTTHQYEAWAARPKGAAKQAFSSNQEQAEGPLSAQRRILTQFVERGKANPEKTVTRRGFRQRFIRGVIRDDLPFSFGEKPGMNACFTYILPPGYQIPNGMLLRRDLNLLYDAIDTKLTHLLQKNSSKLSFACDLWTSKNSVFAFLGLIVFWIDDDWKLHNVPLDFIPVDGNHGGNASSKHIFMSLRQRGLIEKFMASGADNTSSNGVLNRKFCKRVEKYLKQRLLNPDDTQIGCGQHVSHLTVQALQSALGLAPDPDVEDTYTEARQFSPRYSPLEDPEVQEQEELSRQEAETEHLGVIADKSEEADAISSDDSNSELEKNSDQDSESGHVNDTDADESAVLLQSASSGHQIISRKTGVTRKGVSASKQHKKIFSAVDKVHAIAVDILRSEVRRKRMRLLTRKLCSDDVKHLVPVRSIPIRWNTVFAEIERASRLRVAFSAYLEQLTSGLSGKRKAVAVRNQRKWAMSHDDWELIDALIVILKPFRQMTHSFSRADIPTISMVIPFYKLMETKLREAQQVYTSRRFAILRHAIQKGLEKLSGYLTKALSSKYPLLGAVLHPFVRVKYFERRDHNWEPSIAAQATQLLRDIYSEYAATQLDQPNPHHRTSKNASDEDFGSIFATAVGTGDSQGTDELAEVDAYLADRFPCNNEDAALTWWKEHAADFPVLSRVARDVLAIPGVSVAVERLFSSSKHTLSDSRSSMSAKTASMTVLVKEWEKNELFGEVDYLDGVTIHHDS